MTEEIELAGRTRTRQERDGRESEQKERDLKETLHDIEETGDATRNSNLRERQQQGAGKRPLPSNKRSTKNY